MKEFFELLLREASGTWRFRWPAMMTAWAICLVGWFTVFSMPDQFQAQARVHVDTSSRLKSVLGEITNAPDVSSPVTAVRQAMLGRPQLERVARETDLFLRAEDAEGEQRLIEGLLTTISITEGRKSSNKAGLYTISYTDPNKDMSVLVVRTLLNTFVEDVLQQKAEGSEEVQEFLVDQVEHYEKLLQQSEAALAEFKKQNLGLMPGEAGGYFERLQTNIAAAQLVERNLRIASGKRAALQAQLNGEKEYVRGNADSATAGVPLLSGDVELDNRIQLAEATLSEMLLRYTDRHPDVVQQRSQLDQLLAQREIRLSGAAGSSSDGIARAANPIYQSIQIALNETDVEISALRGELADYNARIAELRSVADTVPEVEAELARLTRDYDNNRSLYGDLKQQLEQERIVNEGDERSVIKFEVIDPPAAAIDPVAPNRPLLIIVIFVLAAIIGGLVAYLMHQMRPVFHDARGLRQELGLPVLGEISMTWLTRYQVKRRVGMTTFSLVGIGLVVTFVGVLLLREPGALFVQALLDGLSGAKA